MEKVSDYIKEKLKNERGFKKRYALIQQRVEIAKVIIQYRIDNNLTQKGLADELGVSQQYISKLEEGNFSTLAMVEKVLNLIGYHLILGVKPL